MNKNGVSTLKVAGAYIGTVVGAGFATGQEILQFFTRFGLMGLAGLVIATVMFIMFGYIIMDLGNKLRANSHYEIIKYAGGRKLGTIIDIIITFFLFGSFTAMIAGTGALVWQQFKLPIFFGNLFMAVITAFTVLTGIKGIINIISMVVPFLLVAVVSVSIYSILTSTTGFTSSVILSESSLLSNWLIASVLYVSYNIITSIAVLGPLGFQAQDKKIIIRGAVLGGFGLGLGAVMINLALSSNLSEMANIEVPMLKIAGKMSDKIQTVYAVVLIAEIYTTAVGSLYGFVSRFSDIKNNKITSRLMVAFTSAAALLASQFGFSNLVKYLYPIVGYCGVVLLICLFFSKIFKNWLLSSR
ncbi:MAG: hypothetical protein AB7V48_06530 [Sedimentibacter sp.]